MGDAEELNLLREAYEHALGSYEAIALALNRHLAAGTRPSAAELQRERDARAQLEQARRLFLDAWLLP
jgi:hypothetical protein